MKPAILLAALALAMPVLVAAQPSRDAALHAFLQERFAEDRSNYADTRYAHGWADLNGDGRSEAFVYLMSGNVCGSGGCDLFIYTPEQNSFYQLARTSVTQPPIRVLNSRTGGWRNIAVGVSGGGTRARTVLLAQRGGTYPDNPSAAPARTLTRIPPGRVVIAADDRGRPLF
ncbi:hypothetical protein [Sphingosinicella sp.]|uniref:hypothetical protein n=1 Tax=Sphingosinicella sp. TaxID=1917971 RepID=UPI004037CDB0